MVLKLSAVCATTWTTTVEPSSVNVVLVGVCVSDGFADNTLDSIGFCNEDASKKTISRSKDARVAALSPHLNQYYSQLVVNRFACYCHHPPRRCSVQQCLGWDWGWDQDWDSQWDLDLSLCGEMVMEVEKEND